MSLPDEAGHFGPYGGKFVPETLMPALSRTGGSVAYIADLNGAAATHLAGKFGAERAVTDYREVLDDADVNAVLIAVQHNLHARFVCETLEAGKHAFVEKPLAMSVEEIGHIRAAVERRPELHVTVGFNRRFSPHARKARELLAGRSEPLAMTMTVNAGDIPPDHWLHDPERGGGRIVGEA
ncbi:MAG: Gfo/Idh/MocA family oxidoreductase, partial [Planctomycetota bacterium]